MLSTVFVLAGIPLILLSVIIQTCIASVPGLPVYLRAFIENGVTRPRTAAQLTLAIKNGEANTCLDHGNVK